MKKLLLLLLPALILTLTACNTDKNETRAKEITGTYDCSRNGTIILDKGNNQTIKSPINYTYDATISHLGGDRIQLDIGGVFIGQVKGNTIMFDTYILPGTSELLQVSYNIDMSGSIYKINGVWAIDITETYSGTAQGPNETYSISGSGLTKLLKK